MFKISIKIRVVIACSKFVDFILQKQIPAMCVEKEPATKQV